MPKGSFPYLTMKDLMNGLQDEWDIAKGKGIIPKRLTPPSRPTLYHIEDSEANRKSNEVDGKNIPLIWKASSCGANGWRRFNTKDLDTAIEAICKYHAIR